MVDPIQDESQVSLLAGASNEVTTANMIANLLGRYGTLQRQVLVLAMLFMALLNDGMRRRLSIRFFHVFLHP